MSEAGAICIEAVVIPFTLFLPLIKDVADVLLKVIDLYETAQHNKKIAKLLTDRIDAANNVIKPLDDKKLKSPIHYANLQSLVLVLKKMEAYCDSITHYNKLQKILEAKSIESKYKDLCEDYNNSISVLGLSVSATNLDILVDFKTNTEKDIKILRDEIDEVLKFQKALAETMVEKSDEANKKLDTIVKQVGEIQNTMQILQNEQNEEVVKQKKIDKIFNEVPLKFEDYKEADEDPRSDKLRKYIHIRREEEYAFKTVLKEYVDQVRNQVTILKKIRDCQNVIQFYGYTESNEHEIYYLVTEWAEKGSLYEYILNPEQSIDTELKLSFAFDIAKGLNFLNTIMIVHRDIRSENVVITEHNVAKITNFKLSRGFNEATGNLKVDKNSVRHNSPEILKRGLTGEKKKYDTKCEVYSFGILLWELAECKVSYQNIEDFVILTNKVIEGYREEFSPNDDIPERYKTLVIKAIDQNPNKRPTFAKMLTDLREIFRREKPSRNNSYEPSETYETYVRPKPPQRKESLLINWSPQEMTIDDAEKHHNKGTKDKKELYKCFDSYAIMGNPKGKYYKAYYITKSWSDLEVSQAEKIEIATKLFKEVADYGDGFPEAQLRYATMLMKKNKGPTEEAMEYLLKAAKNDHPVAMYNVATFYFGKGNEELGRYYMIKSAGKGYADAIKYCKGKNITLS